MQSAISDMIQEVIKRKPAIEGDVSYNTDSRESEDAEKWWYGSTMIRQDGYIYFVDDDDMKVEDIKPGYCWFKARKEGLDRI